MTDLMLQDLEILLIAQIIDLLDHLLQDCLNPEW